MFKELNLFIDNQGRTFTRDPRLVEIEGVQELQVYVTQSSMHIGSDVKTTVSLTNWKDDMKCSNKSCYNGGLYIAGKIFEAVHAGRTEFEGSSLCRGYEGNKRQRVRDCLHSFKWRGTIVFKSQTPGK